MDAIEARRHAQAQWTANPCGAVEGVGSTLAYFEAVERERYQQQPWQRHHFRFDRFAGKRVLEIGVGLGTDLAQFAKHGAQCHGVDITERHLELARRNFALRGLEADLRKADATALPFADHHFDAVYSFGVLHHIPDVEAAMNEIRRVLKPRGEFMVALYHKFSKDHFSLIVRGIVSGRLMRLGYAGLLSTIEAGADGVRVKPYVRLYSRRDLAAQLRGFDVRDISVKQLHAARAPAWAKGLLAAAEPALGWYVCALARKH